MKALAELCSPGINELPERDRLLETVSESMSLDAREKLAVELVGKDKKELVNGVEFTEKHLQENDLLPTFL